MHFAEHKVLACNHVVVELDPRTAQLVADFTPRGPPSIIKNDRDLISNELGWLKGHDGTKKKS